MGKVAHGYMATCWCEDCRLTPTDQYCGDCRTSFISIGQEPDRRGLCSYCSELAELTRTNEVAIREYDSMVRATEFHWSVEIAPGAVWRWVLFLFWAWFFLHYVFGVG